MFTPFSARVPQLRFDLDRTKAQRLDVPVSDVFTVLQTNLGGSTSTTSTSTARSGRSSSRPRGPAAPSPTTSAASTSSTDKGQKVPLELAGRRHVRPGRRSTCRTTTCTTPPRSPASPPPGISSGQAIAAMEEVADEVLPEGFSYEWTGTTFQEQKTGNVADAASSPCRSSASSCSWRPSTRAGSARW